MNRLVKLAKSILPVILPVVILLTAFNPVVLADDSKGNWKIEGDKVYVDNSDYYLSATPATLKGSGWVDFEIVSKGYEGKLDLVWGISGLDTDIDFSETQAWKDNVKHDKERYKEEEQRLELVLDNVKSTVPADMLSIAQYGETSDKNDTAVTFTIEGLEGEFELEIKEKDYEVKVKCDYYSLISKKATIYYYEMVEVKEKYVEYYPDYDYLTDAKTIEYSAEDIEGANRWVVQKLDDSIVAGETYKARCYIEMPFTGLESKEYKYAYGVKPHGESIEQAYLGGSLWLIDPWLDPSWGQRLELTIDHDDVDTDLVDFPVMVYLSASSGITSADVSFVFDELVADANRKKIAVTTDDEVTECYVEIEKWDDANEKAWLHVNVPAVSSTIDTTLYLYYDIGHADNNTYVGDTNDAVAENVWDSNFKAVYHMADGADNAHIYDSTGNDNDGTKKGAAAPNEVAGQIGSAQEFDGTDYISLPLNAVTNIANLNAYTVEGLAYPTSNYQEGIIVWGNSANNNPNVALRYLNTLGGAEIAHRDDASNNSESVYNSGINQWICLAGVRHAVDSFEFFSGGVSRDTDATSIGATTVDNLEIGNWHRTSRIFNFNGTICEVRISNIARPAEWIKATKESLWDNLITFGSEETPIVPTVQTNNASINNTTATLNGAITGIGSYDPIDYRGFVWDTATHPAPGNVAPAASGYANTWTDTGAFGVGAFDYDAIGLTELTTYYFRVCIHGTENLWVYGEELSFFTTVDGLVYLEFRPDLDETIIRGNAGVPSDATVGIYNGYSLPIWNAGAGVNEQLSLLMCVPDRWDGDSDIIIHIITALANTNESGHEYQLQVDWEHVTPNEEEVPITTHTITNSRTVYSDTQYECYKDHLVILYDADTPDDIAPDDQIALRIRRIAAPKVELDGEIIILGVHLLFARGDFMGDPTGNIITIINNMINTGSLIGGESVFFLALLFGAIGMTIAGYYLRNIPVVYGGAGIWAILAGYTHGEATSIALNTGIWDTYGMIFWIAIAMVIVCMLEPVIYRKSKALAEEVAVLSDEESEAKSYSDMREQLDRRKELYQSRRARRIKQSKFARTGEAKIE